VASPTHAKHELIDAVVEVRLIIESKSSMNHLFGASYSPRIKVKQKLLQSLGPPSCVNGLNEKQAVKCFGGTHGSGHLSRVNSSDS